MVRLNLTEEEQEQYDSWSKDEVYVAFVDAYRTAQKMAEEIKRLNRLMAAFEHDMKKLKVIT